MHGNQWVLKIAVLKYYSVSKRGTTAKSNPKQATDPISLHTKFGDNSSNTFPLNERKPCVTPDIGRRTPDIGHRTAKKAKIIYPPPRGVDIIRASFKVITVTFNKKQCNHCNMFVFQIMITVRMTGICVILYHNTTYVLITSMESSAVNHAKRTHKPQNHQTSLDYCTPTTYKELSRINKNICHTENLPCLKTIFEKLNKRVEKQNYEM